MSRRQSREISLQILYLTHFNNTIKENDIDELIKYFCEINNFKFNLIFNYSKKIIIGTLKNIDLIDNEIQNVLHNWKLERLSLIDLNILRMAIFEIMFCEDIPKVVIINEANELAKRYSNKNSNKFVNGILDKIIKKRGLNIEPVK
ncbi:MAG TPA: transcription antitermination factor NusB [bacterium]|nr:transcription antitermination factor NusB [bacterium]HOL47349.1 transcription antitermination factor NusB [bacterium]HPQ17984.1 transcription antitermination factor NusB [bacterium]